MTGFDEAVRAVVDGDVEALGRLLSREPGLVHARSGDAHRATLLHYVAANGVADELQRSPPNAVEVCRRLLAAGADPDARNDSYGGGPLTTPLCLLVSSWHPYAAGVQAPLVRALVEGGASVEGVRGDGAPLWQALRFGYREAAETLVACGARAERLAVAAGLGDLERVERRLEGAPAEEVQEALHLAVTHLRYEVAERLLEAGADPNGRVSGHHAELPLMQAVFLHHAGMARWLLARGADPAAVCGKWGQSARERAAGMGEGWAFLSG